MLITSVEQIGRKKYKVFLDYEYAFAMYDSQIYQYDIEAGCELTQEKYDEILNEYMIPKAKKKAMEMLKNSDKTEGMLRRKLAENYPEQAVSAAIDYLNLFHYIDDERYVRQYYLAHKDTKSYMEIVMQLKNNGVSKALLEKVVTELCEDEESVEDGEKAAVIRQLKKKGVGPESEKSYEEMIKIKNALYRKGFKMDIVERAIDELTGE